MSNVVEDLVMVSWFREIDRVLRGDAGVLQEGSIQVRGQQLFVANVLLAMVYGACLGFFGLFNRDEPDVRFMLAAMVKMPALFFSTLIVTFPSLYVFNALVGSRLTPVTLGRLMMATLGVTTALLASLGPIVAFFSVTTPSYPFMLLLNVAVCASAGLFGLRFLTQAMHRLTRTLSAAVPSESSTVAEGPSVMAAPPTPREPVAQVRTVFVLWMVVFGLVGAQMSWILRPFLGGPNTPFAWFRPRSSNFFESVVQTLRALFGG